MRSLACTLAVLAGTLCACSVTTGLVREQAARDLQCSQEQLTIHVSGGGRFAVSGCHAFAAYRCATSSHARTLCVRQYLPDSVPPSQRAAQVRHKAASLLACDPAALNVRERSAGRFDVEGCGRAVAYECVSRDDCCAFTRPGVQPIDAAVDPDPVPPRQAGDEGSLSKKEIVDVIAASIGHVRACLEPVVKDDLAIAGAVDSKFIIAPDGSVEASAILRSSLDHPGVEGCVAGAVSKLKFAKPDGGGIVVVTYPFVLTSRDGPPFARCR